ASSGGLRHPARQPFLLRIVAQSACARRIPPLQSSPLEGGPAGRNPLIPIAPPSPHHRLFQGRVSRDERPTGPAPRTRRTVAPPIPQRLGPGGGGHRPDRR